MTITLRKNGQSDEVVTADGCRMLDSGVIKFSLSAVDYQYDFRMLGPTAWKEVRLNPNGELMMHKADWLIILV